MNWKTVQAELYIIAREDTELDYVLGVQKRA